MPAAHFLGLRPRLVFAQYPDDLLLAEATPFHRPSPFSGDGLYLISAEFRGAGHDLSSCGLVSLLLALRFLLPRRRTVALAETLSAPPIASLDEARRQVVRAAVAAYELHCLRLALGLVPGQSPMLSFSRHGPLTTCQFRAFHSLGLLQP